MSRTTYMLKVSSRNSDGVKATMLLEVEAEDRELATALLQAALPGADWARWTSTWGVTELAGPKGRP